MHNYVGTRLLVLLALFSSLLFSPRAITAEGAVVIGVTRDTQTAPATLVAQAKGYFEKHGVEGDVRFFGNGSELMQAIAAGSVQMGAPGAVPATSARAGGVPIEILSTLSNVAGAQSLIAGKDSGIARPHDLEGKSVGMIKGSTPELFYREVLKRYSIDGSKVQVQNLDGPGIVTAIQRGDIQAAFIYQPFVERAVSFGARVLLTGTRSYIPGSEGPQRTFTDYVILVARSDFITGHPAAVHGVAAAIADGTEYVNAHREEAVSIVAKALGQNPTDVKLFMSQNDYQMVLTTQVISDLNTEATFLASVGTIKKMVDPASWINTGALKAVRPDAVRF